MEFGLLVITMATYDGPYNGGSAHDGAVGAATASQSSMVNPDLGISIHRYGSGAI